MREYFKINKEFKKYLPVFMIMLAVIILLGSSYALLRSSDVGTNTYVMNVSNLEVTFQDASTNTLNISNMVPMTDEEGLSLEDGLTFTIKNTGQVPAIYSIYIEETSTNPEFKTVVRYVSSEGNANYSEPELLSEDNYIDRDKSLDVSETKTYKVKCWLDEQADSTYMNKTFSARIVIEVLHDSVETAADLIISKYGTETNLVAVNTNGTLYNGTGEIREYRYSGATANNYVIFNDDGDGTIEANELWRIVGIFKNAEGNWNLKLMRNTLLTAEEVPETYVISGTTYSIAASNTSSNVYWNSTQVGTNYNDWTTAGLQLFLNTNSDSNGTIGYYSIFTNEAKSLIDDNYTYYLGNVTSIGTELDDTPISAYNKERNVGNIWEGNFPTWSGAISLLYPSDYGYSADSSYWSGTTLYSYNSTAYETSWMQQTANHSVYEWFLSPSASLSDAAIFWNSGGDTRHDATYSGRVSRPVLNLKSNVIIKSGSGTQNDPYMIGAGPNVDKFDYNSSNKYYTYYANHDGRYKIELWGAQGGNPSLGLGGNGAYTSGEISLTRGEILYVYVGGSTSQNAGGYNGGGNGITSNGHGGYGGGGATDIRYFGSTTPSTSDLAWNSTLGLNSRIMVAGGGGGGTDWEGLKGGVGGTFTAPSLDSLSRCQGVKWTMIGGSQTAGYAFGIGGSGTAPVSAHCGYEGRGGGGGGYYGGYAQTSSGVDSNIGGAGGSSFISGHTGSVAITSSSNRTPRTGTNGASCADGTTDNLCSIHYSGKVFTNTVMVAGSDSMTSPGGDTITGKTYNGYAKITYLGK